MWLCVLLRLLRVVLLLLLVHVHGLRLRLHGLHLLHLLLWHGHVRVGCCHLRQGIGRPRRGCCPWGCCPLPLTPWEACPCPLRAWRWCHATTHVLLLQLLLRLPVGPSCCTVGCCWTAMLLLHVLVLLHELLLRAPHEPLLLCCS